MRSFTPKSKTVNFILMNGGVGDHVGSLVALDYIVKNYTWVKPIVYVPDFFLEFTKHILPNTMVYDYSSMRTKYNHNLATKTTQWDGHTSPMKISGVDYAFLKLCDELPDISNKNYPKVNIQAIDTSNFTLPARYVVLTTGFTASVREFPATSINEIVTYLVNQDITPVFLGQTATKTGAHHVIKGKFDTNIDFIKGVNLINKTTLLQTAKIMAGAEAVLGVDNGLLHIAGCTDVKIIGGFTTVTPEIRMPVRNNILGWNYYPVVPDPDLSCKFCQVKTNFLYGHDYTGCMYRDTACVSQMTADKFIKNLVIRS